MAIGHILTAAIEAGQIAQRLARHATAHLERGAEFPLERVYSPET
jgi:hypothetical protein